MAEEYKGFNIVSDGTYGLKRIATIGRGSLPNSLKGRFTSAKFAREAIDAHLATKPKGKKKNGEADIGSTD